MKTIMALLGVATLLPRAYAAPAEQQRAIATTNPLAGFPELGGLEGRPGMFSVDRDGVYRAYTANGEVVDAARLTSVQIQTWVDFHAPHLSKEEADAERTRYSSIDLEAITDDQLLSPSESNKPRSKLEQFGKWKTPSRDLGSLLEKRQIPQPCPAYYCFNTPWVCPGANCVCGGAICQEPPK